MSTVEIAEPADLIRRLKRRRDDAFETRSNLGLERRGHGMSGFTHGDYEDARVGVEIVEVIADSKDSTLAVDVAREGAGDGGVLECGREDAEGGVAHFTEELITGICNFVIL